MNVHLEKLVENEVFLKCIVHIEGSYRRFFCETVYTIKFVVKGTIISSIYVETVSSIISEIFNKTYITSECSFHPFDIDDCR